MDANQNPKCTVVVPMWNAESWITYTLRSVQEQTYRSWECIVINDGSTDNSRSIVEGFVKNDVRFKLINIPNAGPANARNLGILNALGDYIAFLDADDIWLLNKLDAQMTLLEDNALADFTLSDYFVFQDSTLKVLGTVQLKRFGKMMRQWFNFVGEGPAAASTLLIKKEAITRIGGYNTSLRSTADLELMLRLQRGFEPIRNKKILVGYRQHKKQMHSNLNALSEEFLVLSKVHIQSKKQEKRHKKKANNYFYLANAAQKLDINALGYVRAVVLKPEVILLLLQLFKKLLLRKNRIMKKRTNKLLIEELLLLHNF